MRDVDHDGQVERLHRVAEAGGVGERVHRVDAVDPHRPEPLGVVGEDLLGDRVAGDQPGDDPRAGDRRPLDLRPARHARPAIGAKVECRNIAARLGEVAGEDPEQLVQVGGERAVRGLLDAEVLVGADADSAAAMRRAARRISSSGTPQRCAYSVDRRRSRSAVEHGLGAGGVLGRGTRGRSGPPGRARRRAPRGTRRRCPAGPAGGRRPSPRSRCGAGR